MEKNSGEGKAGENMNSQGYGLRDNRKKSWKSLGFVDDSSGSEQKFPCKVCGKTFEAMKALFGHMRHHSRKEKKPSVSCQECGRKFPSLRALTGHMRLHPVKLRVSGEAGCGSPRKELALESIPVRRKRSKRGRYGNAPNSSLSSLNESSGVVEIEHDVEDVALCLMMLSKGVRNWSEFNSFRESLDNNPDSSEINSVHQNKEIVQINGNDNPFCDEDGSFQMKKPRVDKSDSDALASMNVSSENKMSKCEELDSGILACKEKKIGSEASSDMFCRGVESRVTNVDDESGFELYDAEIEEKISGEIMTFRSIEVESRRNLREGFDLVGLAATESSSSKDAMSDDCDAETGGDSLNKLISAPFNSDMPDDFQKKNKYKCRTCNKTFKSHQALGGHQTFHRKSNNCTVEQFENHENNTQGSSSPETEPAVKLVKKIEYVENSMDQEMDGLTSYGTSVYKEHRCQICFKVFASGQALGGHKRSHISETRDRRSEKQLDYSGVYDVIDPSLPAAHNEESNGDVGFKSCRVGTDCRSKLLVHLVAN